MMALFHPLLRHSSCSLLISNWVKGVVCRQKGHCRPHGSLACLVMPATQWWHSVWLQLSDVTARSESNSSLQMGHSRRLLSLHKLPTLPLQSSESSLTASSSSRGTDVFRSAAAVAVSVSASCSSSRPSGRLCRSIDCVTVSLTSSCLSAPLGVYETPVQVSSVGSCLSSSAANSDASAIIHNQNAPLCFLVNSMFSHHSKCTGQSLSETAVDVMLLCNNVTQSPPAPTQIRQYKIR